MLQAPCSGTPHTAGTRQHFNIFCTTPTSCTRQYEKVGYHLVRASCSVLPCPLQTRQCQRSLPRPDKCHGRPTAKSHSPKSKKSHTHAWARSSLCSPMNTTQKHIILQCCLVACVCALPSDGVSSCNSFIRTFRVVPCRHMEAWPPAHLPHVATYTRITPMTLTVLAIHQPAPRPRPHRQAGARQKPPHSREPQRWCHLKPRWWWWVGLRRGCCVEQRRGSEPRRCCWVEPQQGCRPRHTSPAAHA